MINDKFIYAVLGFFILFSCNSSSRDELSKNFDVPLIEKNELLRHTSNYYAIITLNKKYLKIAIKENYREGEALCYINMANVNLNMGNYKNTQWFLKKAEANIHNSNNDIIKTRLYQEYSMLSNRLRFYEHGLEYNAKAMYYAKRIKPSKVKNILLGKTYYERGDLLDENRLHDSALIYLHKALYLKKKPLYECSIAKHHMRYTHNMDSAAIYIKRTETLLNNKPGLNAQYPFIYYNIGTYYDTVDDDKKALINYKKALIINDRSNNTYYFSTYYIYLALADLYKKIGETQQENYYLQQYVLAKENIDQKQHEVANLTVKDFISEIKQSEKEKIERSWIYLTILIFIFVILGTLSYKKITILKHRKQILTNQAESLKHQTKTLKNETQLLKVQIHHNRLDEIIELAKKNDSTFLTRFREVYPNFINKLLDINPGLENSELVFCAMLKLNFSSKEISNYMFIQHKSAQQKKNRIRKRLNLSSDQDLYLFFSGIN